MFKRNRAISGFTFKMRHRTTGAAITTGTVSGAVIKDGGTSAALTGTISHISNGRWKVDTITAAEMDAFLVHLEFTHTDGDRDFLIPTILFDPYDTARLGLTALPAALPDSAGGAFVIGGLNAPIADVGFGPAEIWNYLISSMLVLDPGSIGFKLALLDPGVPQSGDNYALLGVPAGASIAADIASIKVETAIVNAATENIQTRIPAALIDGRIDANVSAIDNNQAAAQSLARGALGIIRGTCNAGSTTAVIQTLSLDPGVAVNNQFKSRFLAFGRNTVTAALRGHGVAISAVSLSGAITVSPPLPATPQSGDDFTIT